MGLEPNLNPDWVLNPQTESLNSGSQTHCLLDKISLTWYQDFLKLRFSVSGHRKNLVRDKVVDKK